MSITEIVENDAIKLPMHVPDGTSVELRLPRERVVHPQAAPGGLLVFRKLQRELELTVEAADNWKNRVAGARR